MRSFHAFHLAKSRGFMTTLGAGTLQSPSFCCLNSPYRSSNRCLDDELMAKVGAARTASANFASTPTSAELLQGLCRLPFSGMYSPSGDKFAKAGSSDLAICA